MTISELAGERAALERLEAKLERLASLVEAVSGECARLRQERAELEARVEELKTVNMELTRQVNDLKMLNARQAESFDKEAVRRKIDHMLEKFAELQL